MNVENLKLEISKLLSQGYSKEQIVEIMTTDEKVSSNAISLMIDELEQDQNFLTNNENLRDVELPYLNKVGKSR